MKIKLRKQSLSGVKPSTCSDPKLATKLDAINGDITNQPELISNKHCDKNDKMSVNSAFTNGSATANIDANSKSINSGSIRNFHFKEKRKSINHDELKNQLSISDEEISKGNSHLAKNYSKDQSNHFNGLSADKKVILNGNNCDALTDSTNNSSNVSGNKQKENSNNEFWAKNSSHAENAKRDILSEPTNFKKIKTDHDKTIELKPAPFVATASTMTEPDCLGFAEPGTSVVLEGAVLDEIEGVLVVNVTWRGKTYVGTLLDCTKHDWASPRFCDSPSSSDLESKGGSRFRSGKRSRGSISENENNLKLPQSKLRNGKGRRNASASVIRDEQQDQQQDNNSCKRSNNSILPDKNNNSTSATTNSTNQTKNQQSSPVLIRCPNPTCNKRYRHINGLKYHQAHHPHHEVSDNSSKPSNKTSEQTETNKESEETTDTEEYLNKKGAAPNKLNSKNSKFGGKERKSPFSDISDDTENESRPSSNNSENTSQPTNLSAKKEEIGPGNNHSSNLLLNADKLSNKSEDHGNLKTSINKDSMKTDNELRKLASEVDLKMGNAAPQPYFLDKQPLNAPVNATSSNAFLNNPSLTKANCNSLFSQNFTMEPALHTFLMQTDLSYRLNYERYVLENQEKLLEFNSLSGIQQNPTAFTSFNNFVHVGKDSVFKSPANNLPTNVTSASSNSLSSSSRILSKPNEPSASSSSTSSASGGSIVNGTSNQSQAKNAPSPYDFMEYEKQMEKQREEMFRLSSSNIKMKDSPQMENQFNGSKNKMRSDEETNQPNQIKGPHNFFNFASNVQTSPSTASQSYINPNSVLANFSPLKAPAHPLPFDPAFFNRSGHFSPSFLNGPQQSAFINHLDSLRFSNVAGLSQIDLNSAQSSKLMTAASQQPTNLSGNSKHQTNELPRTKFSAFNQSSTTALNASNKSEDKDENRSPSLRNPPSAGVGFQTTIDPFGELIQQASSTK